VVVLVHGVMCTEDVWTFEDGSGSDYGALLARDLGFTPIYVRYNSGRALGENGRDLAVLLAQLCAAYPLPIEEILLVGYSMGGLLVRSACHFAAAEAQPWLAQVRRAIYVGTPHLGAPAERAGRVVAKLLQAIPDPYTRLVADISNLRSTGVKDLGDAFRDPRNPVPLLPQIRHYLIAGQLSGDPRVALLLGDAIVPVSSATHGALGEAAHALLPPERVKVLTGLSHLALPRHSDVYNQIKAFCEESVS
jgi:pimeloyl-ACP methyl ester carboxylesterase